MTRLYIILIIFCSNVVRSQSGSNDISFISQHTNLFGDGSAFDGEVKSIAIQPDGKVILGGSFTSYNGVSRNGLVRVHPDGSIDTGFEIFGGFNSNSGGISINDIAVQNDGKIIVGGSFDVYNGNLLNNIARLNPDGSLDQSFLTGLGFGPDNYGPRVVNTICLQTDGKIIVGGNFMEYNGIPTFNIVRLNPDGIVDQNFSSGSGFDGYINTLSVNTAGKIIVGGAFSIYNGNSTNCVIQLNDDGTIDSGFNIGFGPDGIVKTIAIQSNGSLLVGGDFANFNGTSRNKITRLSPTGTNDPSFNIGSGISGISFPTVNRIVIQPDGIIGVAGQFSNYNGTSANSLVLINPNGSLYSGFNGFNGVNGEIRTCVIQPDGKYLIGGAFDLVNSIPFNKNCRLNVNGTLDKTFNLGMGVCGQGFTFVNASCVTDDGKTVIGGRFRRVNGKTAYNISRLNFDGTTDTTFITGTGFNDQVYVVVHQPDGKYLVGGVFTSFNGINRNGIARLNSNGTLDLSFNPGSGVFGTNEPSVYTIKVLPSGKILAGGDFTSYNGNVANRIVRINSNGTIDNSFVSNSGFNDVVSDIVVQPDNKVVVGGSFSAYNGISANNLVRLNPDGSHDPIFNAGSGLDGSLFCLEIQSDGKILVGGLFNYYNGVNLNNLIRLNSDGSLDQSFINGQGFDHYVKDLLLSNEGKIVVCGAFSHINGYFSPGYARLDSTGILDLSFSNSSAQGIVNTASLFADGRVFIGGDFLMIGTDSRNRIGRLLECDLTNYSITACHSYTWPLNGQTYTTSGNYQDTISVWYGCDSIVHLDLTIIPGEIPNIVNFFAVPSDTIQCLGAVQLEISGNEDFYLSINGSNELLQTSGEVVFDSLCPGIHPLSVYDACDDSLNTYFVVPSNDKHYYNNTFTDSIPVDSLGVLIENCAIDFNQIDTIYIDTFWRLNNLVFVNWKISELNSSLFDTISYTINNNAGVYMLQYNLFCNADSNSNYLAATQAIYVRDLNAATDEEFEKHIFVYPNPVHSSFTIRIPDNNGRLLISDLSGKIVYERTINSGDNISINAFSEGIYVLTIITESSIYSAKILKQ